MRRLVVWLGIALLIGAAGTVAWRVASHEASAGDESSAADDAPADVFTERVEVRRSTLTEEEDTNGTVSYGSATQLPLEVDGIVTSAPEQDDVIRPGDVLVDVDDRPITVVRGSMPMYRELRRVGSNERDEAGDRLGLQEGDDVAQLQRFLVSNGFDDDGALDEIDGVFGPVTERAVEDWQESVGLPATGRVDRSQIIFADEPMRIEEAPDVGDRFPGITVTGTRPVVTADVSNRQRSYFGVGSHVEIDAGGDMVAGTVTSSERRSAPEGTVYQLEIELADGADLDGIESVKVTATKVIAGDVLTVPARALLALAEGGWAVQVPDGAGTRLVRVELGDVVEGLAEIEGLAEGDEVVVPI